jgi:hypothetical protein
MSYCDGCTLCCKLFGMDTPGFEKEVNEWCQHCDPARGCKIYEARPAQCVDYECLALQCAKKGKPLPPELKPSKCKVIFDMNATQTMMIACVDPSYRGAERKQPVERFVRAIADAGIPVIIVCGSSRYVYLHENDPGMLARIESLVKPYVP